MGGAAVANYVSVLGRIKERDSARSPSSTLTQRSFADTRYLDSPERSPL